MNYHRLLTRLYNTPLAIIENKLDIITQNVTLNLIQGKEISNFEPTVRNSFEDEEVTDNIGIINIYDSLVSKNGAGNSGVTSYESIIQKSLSHIEDGKTTLIYNFDTGGGEFSGVIATSDFIKSLPKKYGVKTIGFVDGMAASAGYVLLSGTQKIYTTESSLVGSIAAILTRIDTTQKDKQDGIKYEIYRSKNEKALTNPHEKISSKEDEALKSVLAEVDRQINEVVSSNRESLSLETIINLNGRLLFAKEALELNLIDGIVPSLQVLLESEKVSNKKTILPNQSGKTMTLEELQAKVVSLETALSEAKASTSQAVTNERERIMTIHKQVATFNLSQAFFVDCVEKNFSTEQSKMMCETLKAATQVNIDTANDPTVLGFDKDYKQSLEDAKSRAKEEDGNVIFSKAFEQAFGGKK